MPIQYKNPEYIVINTIDEDDATYSEISITDKARIPVIALSYDDRDIAKNKELLVDYKNGGIYVVDAEDRTIIHDLSKLISENYLSQIDGENTYVNIEGLGIINLADILKLLYESRIQLVNRVDESISLPAGVSFDNKSICIAGNMVEVYGFHNAKPLSTPRVSEDGTRIEWVNGVEEERPGNDIGIVDEPPGGFEPPLGAVQNVLYIYPTDDHIILYNKPQQLTMLSEVTPVLVLEDTGETVAGFIMDTPLTTMQYAKYQWRLDTTTDLVLVWGSNITWINPEAKDIPANSVTIFTFETWNYGNTWIVSYVQYDIPEVEITADDLADYTLYTDEDESILKSGDGSLLTAEDESEE